MTAETLLRRQNGIIFSVKENEKMCNCIAEMNDKHVGALVVMDDNGNVSGIISERDVLKLVQAKKGEMCDIPVKDVMTTKDKLITTQADDHIANVMDKMTHNNIRHIIIMDGDDFKGMASIRDIVKILLDNALLENKQLMDYVYQAY